MLISIEYVTNEENTQDRSRAVLFPVPSPFLPFCWKGTADVSVCTEQIQPYRKSDSGMA